ncbi:MAG: response regulator, partial [Undibacterium sp.]|nr:response regulator [Undibacterium sp.]
ETAEITATEAVEEVLPLFLETSELELQLQALPSFDSPESIEEITLDHGVTEASIDEPVGAPLDEATATQADESAAELTVVVDDQSAAELVMMGTLDPISDEHPIEEVAPEFVPHELVPEVSATEEVLAQDSAIDNVIELAQDDQEVSDKPHQETAQIIEFPDFSMPAKAADLDNTKRIGNVEISLPLHTIYMAETDEIVRYLAQDFAEWRHEPTREVSRPAVHASHSLAGSSATVGLFAAQELAHNLENVLQRLERHPVALFESEFDLLDQSVECLKGMLQKFALSEMAERVVQENSQLVHLLEAVIARSDVGDDEEFITSTNERVDQETSEVELRVNDELDQDLLPVFIEEGNDLLPMIGQLLRSWQASPQDDAIPQSILRLMHTVKGSARMAGAMQLGQHTHDMETRIENLMHTGGAIRQPLLEDLLARHDYAMHLFDRLQHPESIVVPQIEEFAELSVEQEMNRFQEAAYLADLAHEAAQVQEVVVPTPVVANLDEENTQALVAELPVEPIELRDLLPEPEVAQVTTVIPEALPAPVRRVRQVAQPIVLPSSNAPIPLVRVRADILDRMVNQAGEVSISRSKLENEVDTLKLSLAELTENVSRLRAQLREVEIQAETQITSRMALSGDREFDPLEFDRFTRLQELTRMMAESVSDVASVQTTLSRTIEGASGDLHTQARLTRELQQDLMRVRMIPFSSVSERLYRIARQTAKEVDKRVNLDIRGTTVEMDRGVLEKMVGPFEHMLRNAIVHGVESRQERLAAGKNETGELLIEVRQEGNEVVIHFTDDGQGLHLNRIREKAKAVGLLTDDNYLNESEVVNLIFESGFSTASEVTELAGRGVGMDVVRSEAASLGGRVSVSSVEGKGAHFTIHLPLTLAVTQVVLVRVAGKIYAVPSVLVEQVQQLKVNALAAAYNESAIFWQGKRVPLHYLPSMLGERQVIPDTQQYTPILIMQSDNERVAIHVDQILGNREVVVKNVGPQLARLIGIAGATVLGSGDIVLILNPVPLALKMEHERARLSEAPIEDSHHLSEQHELGAVAEMATAEAISNPVQGLRAHHIIMVVDDSLTVRRVTQRLLVREGYQVVLAKDGIDALEQLQSITPDVMLVDIEMPRMDGFDLTRNVRSDARTKHIPIIMITSRTADKHRNYAAELGVNEYFGKPYREDDLLAAITQFVSKTAVIG